MTIGIATRLAVERESHRSFFSTSEGEKWLDDALKLAGVTSIPSVNNLEVKPSFWFILVDSTLDSSFKQKIHETFSRRTSVPVRMVSTDGWKDSSHALRSNTEAERCTIQVRLDYDDMLHKSFLKKVIDASQSLDEDCRLISPSIGICRELDPPRFARIRKELPPFLALYRGSKSCDMSIFSFDHDKWPNEIVHELLTIPLWVQTITGNNISNQFGRDWMVHSMRHLRTLNLEPWTGESKQVATSVRLVRLRNGMEMLFDVVQILKTALTNTSS